MKTICLTVIVWMLALETCWGQPSLQQLQQNTMQALDRERAQQEREKAERERQKAQHERDLELGRSLFGSDAFWMSTDFHDPLRDKSPSEFQVGDWGCTNASFKILGRASKGLLIVTSRPDLKVILLQGVDMSKATDGLEFVLSHPVVIPETYSYTTVAGTQRTVLVMEVNREKVTEEITKIRAAAVARKASHLAAEKAKQDAIKAAKKRLEDAKRRSWTSADGKFTVDAKFVSLISGVATLERDDGQQIKVGLDRLSDDDQDFIREQKWLALAENAIAAPQKLDDTLMKTAGPEQPRIDVLAQIAIAKHVIQGNWTRTNDGLKVTQKGELRARVVMPFDCTTAYVFRTEFTALSGELAGATITLPVGGAHQVTVLANPKTFRVARLFGQLPNDEIEVAYAMEPKKPHVLDVHVSPTGTQAEIAVLCDGTLVIKWKGPLSALSPAPEKRVFVLEGFRTTTVFSSIEIEAREVPRP
jgi:uncharacterized cupin superfamily protein